MMHQIKNATIIDLPFIYGLFEEAIAFQKANKYVGWQHFDKDFIAADVQKKMLFKLNGKEGVLGIFCICLADPLIWREKERGDAIYLHRIVLNRRFIGARIFGNILDWAVGFATAKDLKYVRMDTWAENLKIIDYYKSYGFRVVENYQTPDTEELPVQHRNLNVALLELEL